VVGFDWNMQRANIGQEPYTQALECMGCTHIRLNDWLGCLTRPSTMRRHGHTIDCLSPDCE